MFYSPAMGDRAMGLNILIGDLDRDEFGADNPYGFHHENSFAGSKYADAIAGLRDAVDAGVPPPSVIKCRCRRHLVLAGGVTCAEMPVR